jgi:hypothetical protein
VYNNYLVACLNLGNIAGTTKKGQVVNGPPFNDRCFQVQGMCGVPCADLTGGQHPPSCTEGIIDQDILINNNITEITRLEHATPWAYDLSLIDWIILITIFLDTLGNIMRFLPMLVGPPTSTESSASVTCSGTAVLGCTTPIVSENEAIFLRGLVGRTLTALHTMGGRHRIKGLYVDTILNESRKDGDDKRLQMWYAWIQFIECLAKMKTKHMHWENNIYDNENSGAAAPEKGKSVMRSLLYKKSARVEFNSHPSRITFEGVFPRTESVTVPTYTDEELEAGGMGAHFSDEDDDVDDIDTNTLLSPSNRARASSADDHTTRKGREAEIELTALQTQHKNKLLRNFGLKAASYDAVYDEASNDKKRDFLDVVEVRGQCLLVGSVCYL